MAENVEQPQIPFTEWCPALERALREPFPYEAHKQKDRKGTFVPYHHYVSRLNTLVGVSGWSMERVLPYHSGSKLGLAIGITILGVTRWNVGDEMEDHGEPVEYTDQQTGEIKEKVVDFGSSSTNSWAQAFKRTCTLFGLGQYLYDKDWTKKYLAKQNGNGAQQQSNASPPAQSRPNHGSNAPRAPQTNDVPACPTCSGRMWDNRAKKSSGEFSANAPDFRCRNKQCDGAITLQEA